MLDEVMSVREFVESTTPLLKAFEDLSGVVLGTVLESHEKFDLCREEIDRLKHCIDSLDVQEGARLTKRVESLLQL